MGNKNSDMPEGDTFKLQQTVALRMIVVHTERFFPHLIRSWKDVA